MSRKKSTIQLRKRITNAKQTWPNVIYMQMRPARQSDRHRQKENPNCKYRGCDRWQPTGITYVFHHGTPLPPLPLPSIHFEWSEMLIVECHRNGSWYSNHQRDIRTSWVLFVLLQWIYKIIISAIIAEYLSLLLWYLFIYYEYIHVVIMTLSIFTTNEKTTRSYHYHHLH